MNQSKASLLGAWGGGGDTINSSYWPPEYMYRKVPMIQKGLLVAQNKQYNLNAYC